MKLRITWYGHATIGFETAGRSVLVDPFFAPHNPASPVTVDDVHADFILQTHGHQDHIADTVALAKRTGALVIAVPEICRWLGEQGVKNTHGMNTGGSWLAPFGRVKMTVAHHSSGLPDGRYGGNPVGFLVNFDNGQDAYIAGDTSLTWDMKLIGDAGGVDVAFLPIGDNFTMGPDDAVVAAQWVRAKLVAPVHCNTWPGITVDCDLFATKLRRSAEIDCKIMTPGETFELE